MASFDAIAALIPALRGRFGAGASIDDAQSVIVGLDDAELVTTFGETAELGVLIEQLQAIEAGVLHARSTWRAGHEGLAQRLGHRSAASLVQALGGMSKAEASRQVRVGEALLDEGPDPAEEPESSAAVDPGSEDSADPRPAGVEGSTAVPPGPDPVLPWFEPLRAALRAGRLTSAQFDAIRRGLGEPPSGAEEAWWTAAGQLVEEASRRTVEELLAHARCVRDLLDPVGAEERCRARYERRAFRTWLDQEGTRRGSMVFDDEGGAFFDTIFAAALRPRRGGPRFVDADEQEAAADLTADACSNDQLAYDLLLDIVRAGVLTDAPAVFGTRQAGLRIVQTIDATGAFGRIAVTEDGLTVVSAAVAERRLCEAGAVTVAVDSCGNPLDVGREERLFTPKQRIGLAVRDGGCRWPGCDRPASYCEAHHIDEWHRDHGRTDIDRGILLCRFHHGELHHGGWRITRDGKDDFILRGPDGATTILARRLPLRYLWGDVDPPPKRFRPAA
ncbi:HNH endonuclease [Microbacterium sp. Au-Mic1]|uniref:HNH endonuclease signature motif containing protein n=1 Tax=Microbacterium sp. Au-Mic1 TaxID=2906457 RepID=UPI001E3E13AF|nr:HNH endonuclease signature motif containing protein [Microbacterium sp. Au-Mic1]MCE4026322.1 HNH endonuclease [Microbacterium sp. Au-Mic1]